MRIIGKKKKNYILEVTPFELERIKTALFEWQGVEDDTSHPDKNFDRVLNRIYKAQNHFESLNVVKEPLRIENKKETDHDTD